MTPNTLHARLTYAEVDPQYAPDCRRVISTERQSLGLALQSGDNSRIKKAAAEAERVARMWGVL